MEDWWSRTRGAWLAFALIGSGCPGNPIEGTPMIGAAGETGGGEDDGGGESGGSSGSGAIPSEEACGNGQVEPGEECDEGRANANDGACTTRCERARCGDGWIHLGVEACDDGNDVDDDACSNACVVATCEDGVRNGAETGSDCGGPDCGPCPIDAGCEDASDCDGATCIEGRCHLAASCLELSADEVDGVYALDPDGDGADLLDARCDMSTDGGGWTLLARVANDGTRRFDSLEAFTDAAPIGSSDDLTAEVDYKSPVYSLVKGNDLMLRTETYAVGWTGLLGERSFGSWLMELYADSTCSTEFVGGTPDILEGLPEDVRPLFDLVVRPLDTNSSNCFPGPAENAIVGVVFPSCCWTYGLGNTPDGQDTWETHDNSMPALESFAIESCDPGAYPCNPAGHLYAGATCYDASCKSSYTEIWIR